MSGFTKQAIQASFLKLLDTYPLRDITVRMITEDCGINRKSFYYHYQDISTSSAPSAKARPNTSSAASTPTRNKSQSSPARLRRAVFGWNQGAGWVVDQRVSAVGFQHSA